ncbi:bile acid:sodium symporter family protein [Nocardia acidivorans]|uniref:bile acid:sodium symporter family protein n=1 Tax=Nocardia acidivorans TaxID=404580 RepID=UPI000835FAAD|nr:bile acid:sodium symporter family protein [Nocardia acidivorans]
MNSGFVAVALPIALGVIMFGLGLSLTPADFTRVAGQPKAVLIALACQMVVLPLVAFGLVTLLDLAPLAAIGLMLLAASPGGATANLFSHLFRGDVALNVSLTAVNSIISVVTVPLITNAAIDHFGPDDGPGSLGVQFGKAVQVFAMVLIPVAIGMTVRAVGPAFADRMDRPVRIASALLLVFVVLGAVLSNRSDITGDLPRIGAAAALLCAISLTVGYWLPRLLGVADRQAVACSMEVGIHNSAIAITIAISILDSTEIAVPAAVYAVFMSPFAAAFGWLISRRLRMNADNPQQNYDVRYDRSGTRSDRT